MELAGSFRPMVGAIFGVAIYVLVVSKPLPLDVPTANDVHFFAGLAFIAGSASGGPRTPSCGAHRSPPSPMDVHDSDFVRQDDRTANSSAQTQAGM